MLEAHGVAQGDRMEVGVRETEDGHVFIETKSISGAYLTPEEALYLATKLRRLANRIDRR